MPDRPGATGSVDARQRTTPIDHHELLQAERIAARGHHVDFRDPPDLDVLVDGEPWELKSPQQPEGRSTTADSLRAVIRKAVRNKPKIEDASVHIDTSRTGIDPLTVFETFEKVRRLDHRVGRIVVEMRDRAGRRTGPGLAWERGSR